MATNQDQKCRLCLTPGLFHMNLFTTSHNAVLAIREIFQCDVDEYDQLPNYICVDCWCLLQQFHEFYRKVIDTQNRFLFNSEPAIKLELMPDEPVQVNSYVEDFNCESQNDAYDTFEMQNDRHESDFLQTDYEASSMQNGVNETSEVDANGFTSMDDNNSNYPTNFHSFNNSKRFVKSSPLKRKRGRPKKNSLSHHRHNNMPMVFIPSIKKEIVGYQPKRKRGRPRKVPDLYNMLQNDSSRGIDDDSHPSDRPVKRGRGRPRKIQNPDESSRRDDLSTIDNDNRVSFEPMKRKRGRPRKVRDSDETLPNDSLQNDDINDDMNDDENDDDDDDDDDDDTDQSFQGGRSGNDDNTDDDTDNETDDDGDEYTPPAYHSRSDTGPKRPRGRPRKIRPEVDRQGGKRKNWRDAKIFQCQFCVRKFTRRNRVNVHMQLRHGFECAICNVRLASEQKLKQHMNIHEEGFETKLRQKLEDIVAIDINDVTYEEKDIIWQFFDRHCDECSTEFESLNEAQVHYLNEHNNERGYIKCCNMRLREDVMIKEHIAYHKNPDLYECFICNTTIKVKSYLRIHLKNHITELLDGPQFVCDVCDKHFSTKSNLQHHVAEVHAKEKIKCDICLRTCFNEAQKVKHTRNAHGTMSEQMAEYVLTHFDMSCDVCDVMFESFSHAKRHYLSEHGDAKGYIKCCSKKMRTLAAIDEHVQWHKNPETLKCPICHKEFKAKDHFRTHVRRHGKTFTCEICGKSFKRHTTLVGHRKAVHESGPRQFPCRFCSLRFLSDEKRDGHEQLIHYGNTTGARIVCDICGKGFLQANHLQKHIQTHHSDDPLKKARKEENKSEMCTICGLWLSSRYRLKLHRKCHSMEPNKCQECGLEAPNHDALLGHIRAFHEVRHKNKCRLCHESFNTANELHDHAATHSNDKLYCCPHCPDTFVWRASLDAHIKKSHPNEWESGQIADTNEHHFKTDPFSQEQ